MLDMFNLGNTVANIGRRGRIRGTRCAHACVSLRQSFFRACAGLPALGRQSHFSGSCYARVVEIRQGNIADAPLGHGHAVSTRCIHHPPLPVGAAKSSLSVALLRQPSAIAVMPLELISAVGGTSVPSAVPNNFGPAAPKVAAFCHGVAMNVPSFILTTDADSLALSLAAIVFEKTNGDCTAVAGAATAAWIRLPRLATSRSAIENAADIADVAREAGRVKPTEQLVTPWLTRRG